MLSDAVDAVLPKRLEHDVVWHYTSPDIAVSILRSHAFWATSIQTMNDRSEMLFGMNLVRNEWDSRAEDSSHWERIDGWMFFAELALQGERLADSYVLCASTDKDSIQQWDRYGICEIGIATEQPLTKQARPESAGGRLGATFTTGWRPVIYDPDEQLNHVAQLFGVLEDLCSMEMWSRGDEPNETDETGIECVLRSIVYLKDTAFASEKEVRLYGQAHATGALVTPHPSKFGPSRHIDVRASISNDDDDDLPIVGLRLADITARTGEHANCLRKALEDESLSASLFVVKSAFRQPELSALGA